jgi:hypothetical protein
MNILHAEFAEGFDFGHDAVLLVMDTGGVKAVLAALTQAEQQGSARLVHGGTIHQFFIEPGAADIEFHEGTVVWRLDLAKAAEMIELLTETRESTDSQLEQRAISLTLLRGAAYRRIAHAHRG